jgi:hypothetical protein
MRHHVTLTVTSLLSILLFTLHTADDIARGIEPGTLANLPAVPIFGAWLYGTLVLVPRRSGYVIVMLASLLSTAVPILHMMGRGLGPIAKTSGGLLFAWTVLALGVTALFSFVLAAQGLWSTLRRARM